MNIDGIITVTGDGYDISNFIRSLIGCDTHTITLTLRPLPKPQREQEETNAENAP